MLAFFGSSLKTYSLNSSTVLVDYLISPHIDVSSFYTETVFWSQITSAQLNVFFISTAYMHLSFYLTATLAE